VGTSFFRFVTMHAFDRQMSRWTEMFVCMYVCPKIYNRRALSK